jgi:hypothetical protein
MIQNNIPYFLSCYLLSSGFMGRQYQFRRPDLTTVQMTLGSRNRFAKMKIANEPMWVVIEKFLNENKEQLEREELIIKLQKIIAADRDIIEELKQRTILSFVDQK